MFSVHSSRNQQLIQETEKKIVFTAKHWLIALHVNAHISLEWSVHFIHNYLHLNHLHWFKKKKGKNERRESNDVTLIFRLFQKSTNIPELIEEPTNKR